MAFTPHPVVFSVELRANLHAAGDTKVEFSWFDTAEIHSLSQAVQGIPPLSQWEDVEGTKLFKKDFTMQSCLGLALGLQQANMEVSFLSAAGARFGCSNLRLCPLLMNKSLKTTRFSCSLPGLLQFEISVSTDVDVLSEHMMNELQPLWIHLKAIKNLPDDAWLPKETKGVMATCYAALSTSTEPLREHLFPSSTEIVKHDIRAKFQGHDMVYFLGRANAPHRVRDWLTNDLFAIEVHDRDKLNVSTEDGQSDPQFPHGICYFSFADLLKPNVHFVELRSDVYPVRGNAKIRYKELRKAGLPCETLLQKETRERIGKLAETGERREVAPEYFSSGCFCQITATRKCPLLPAAELQKIEEEPLVDALVSKETLVEDEEAIFTATDDSGRKVFRFRPPTPEEGDSIPPGPWRHSLEDARKDQEGDNNHRLRGIDKRYEKFSRLVVILDVKNAEICRRILDCIQERNLEATKLTGTPNCVKVLQNRDLTEDEQADLSFDFLSGFIIMDSEVRIIVLEGLREGEAWKALKDILPREKANEAKFKIFAHDDIGFPYRLYGSFSLQLKQIRLRQPLHILTRKPPLYDLTTTDAGIYRSLTKLRDMTRARRLQFAKSTFPTAQDIVTLEILYGDYMSDTELLGGFGPDPTAKTKKMVAAEETALETATLKPEYSRKTLKRSLDTTNEGYDNVLTLRRSMTTPDIKRRNVQKVKERSRENAATQELQGKVKPDLSFLEEKEIYLYSSQKLNTTVLQKAHMRKQMMPHKENRMWTYSPVYNSCSFELEEEHIGRPRCVLREDDRSKEREEPWRLPKARPIIEYRQPTRDLTAYRSAELEEEWAENEWHIMLLCEGRHLPVSKTESFHADKVPHLREETLRPFDANMIDNEPPTFGPEPIYKTVHKPDDYIGDYLKDLNLTEKNSEEKKEIGPHILKFMDKQTREKITDLDRTEDILKDPPEQAGIQFEKRKYVPQRLRKKYGTSSAPNLEVYPTSINISENWNEASPHIEFETRMRGNHDTAPFNVKTGCYVPRHGVTDLGTFPTLRSKRSFACGELTPAPWKHAAQSRPQPVDEDYERRYLSNKDFDRYSGNPRSLAREDFVCKNAARAAIESRNGPLWEPPHLKHQLVS